jgi:hypothetical protein
MKKKKIMVTIIIDEDDEGMESIEFVKVDGKDAKFNEAMHDSSWWTIHKREYKESNWEIQLCQQNY